MAFIHVASKEYKTFCREFVPAAYNFVNGCSHDYNYASQSVHGWSLLCVCLCGFLCVCVCVCVCVVALKAQEILTLGIIRIDMNYKITFISNFWQIYCVYSARKLPTWTVFKRCLLQGFSKKWSTTLFRGCAFCNKSTNADMTELSVMCALLGYYTA
jgi:hypothetical protein